MTEKLNPTQALFSKFGMQNVSPVQLVDRGECDISLGDVRLRKSDLFWVCQTLSSGFNASGIFDDAISAHGTLEYVLRFYEEYLPSVPDEMRGKLGSTSDGGLLCNWLLLHYVRPSSYIESGVFIGASLRLADAAFPEIEKWAYDLSFRPLLYKNEDITYIQNDFSKELPSLPNGVVSFSFFDDHIDPVRRILECHRAGIEWVLFDDSPTFPRLNRYRYPAVPSVSMIMDDDMPDGFCVEWNHPNEERVLRYTHDREYCQSARNLVIGHVDMRNLMGNVGVTCGDKVVVRLKKSDGSQ